MIGKLDKVRGSAFSGGRPLRSVGRVALWAVVVLLLLRGGASVVGGKESARQPQDATTGRSADSQAVEAFAVRYVRAYLADTSPTTVASLLAPGVSIPSGGGPAPAGSQVAQATATATRPIGKDREIVTVSSELRNGDVAFLAVPIARDQAGGVAALGAPAFVSAPGIGRVESEAERSQPIPGADAEDIRKLVSRFVGAYLAESAPADLEYLTAPDAGIAPLGRFQSVGGVTVRQLGDNRGPRRTVLATVHARAVSGVVYPLAYRLQLEKRNRWYVTAVEGEVK